MHYKHTLENIEERTSLKLDFIYRANKKLSAFLAPHRVQGDQNEIFYNDSGIILWDHIKQLKEDNMNLTQIAETLERELRNTSPGSETPSETLPTSPPGSENQEPPNSLSNQAAPISETQAVLDKVLEMQKLYIEDKQRGEDSLKTEMDGKYQAQINELKTKLRFLLPDGRTSEDIQREIRQGAEDREELKQLRRRLHQIESLLSERARIKGQWGRGKRVREIDAKLEQLNAEAEQQASYPHRNGGSREKPQF